MLIDEMWVGKLQSSAEVDYSIASTAAVYSFQLIAKSLAIFAFKIAVLSTAVLVKETPSRRSGFICLASFLPAQTCFNCAIQVLMLKGTWDILKKC